MAGTNKLVFLLILSSAFLIEAGVIKDFFQKTFSNNKTEGVVKQSVPVCGSGIFSTKNESTISPEIIFITGRPSRSVKVNNNDREESSERRRESSGSNQGKPANVEEVAHEFRFNVDNVTIEELERHGFNRDAPISFLMHGFTSGYPLQAWISAIVESYTIDRETSKQEDLSEGYNQGGGEREDPRENSNNRDKYGSYNQSNKRDEYRERSTSSRRREQYGRDNSNRRTSSVRHNLFIINWFQGAKGGATGINYPRAVANIPIVATYVTRFINEKLLREARVEPSRIQLIGHSLGAHLAGFIGKNTEKKVGRIYGLDPAGPCFGAVSGSLYPSSNRLAPTDAEEVITIHTNSALLGIDKPLGKHSVFVEGGEKQPNCKGGGVLKSLSTLTIDDGTFDTVACSHSRAPNLLTYRHDQSDNQDDCQLMAYECKDWESYVAGLCGVCLTLPESHSHSTKRNFTKDDPLTPVECLRVGLDWQYPDAPPSSSSYQRPTTYGYSSTTPRYFDKDEDDQYNYTSTTSRRPSSQSSFYDRQPYNSRNTSSYDSGYNNNQGSSSWNRKPNSNQRDRRAARNSTQEREPTPRRASNESSSSDKEPKSTPRQRSDDSSSTEDQAVSMFLRTGDSQPYCVFQYQIVLELREPFPDSKRPPMSLILQDSESESDVRKQQDDGSSSSSTRRAEQNSLIDDEFGNKFNDRFYTKLLTSGRKLKRVDHATLLFRNGLPEGRRILRSLHVNYMSHSDPKVRRRYSSRLCLVRNNVDPKQREGDQTRSGNRYFFEPCEKTASSSQYDSDQSENNNSGRRTTSRRPDYYNNNG